MGFLLEEDRKGSFGFFGFCFGSDWGVFLVFVWVCRNFIVVFYVYILYGCVIFSFGIVIFEWSRCGF